MCLVRTGSRSDGEAVTLDRETQIDVWVYRYLNEMGQSLYENAPMEDRWALDEAFEALAAAAMPNAVEEVPT